MAVSADTAVGRAGAGFHLDCCATFTSPDGTTLEALILVELGADGCTIAEIHLFPLAPMTRRMRYALVSVDRAVAPVRFAQAACASFTRGTHIPLADGRQARIETPAAGDIAPARDHGRQTMRTLGAFAPVRIDRGVLNNATIARQSNHRLFFYQRRDRVRPATARLRAPAQAPISPPC